ncbi:MAG: lytic murein transglycosylase, partial [Streptomyces sp.]
KKAERALAGADRGCGLRWEILAAIGKVESGQARGGAVDKEGATLKPILGPVLNGSGFAHISDTDGGQFDGDARFDRAVGPMQFIPSTWSRWGTDGNSDGRRDPNNIYDAALSAGKYLCAGERELTVKADLDRAILSYNHSRAYLRTVLAWYEFYRKGTHQVPDGAGPLPTSPGAGGDSAKPGNGKGSPGGNSGPHKPGKGVGNGNPNGGGNEGGGHESPSPTPTTPTAVKPVSKSSMSAPMGEKYTTAPQVRVTDKAGRTVKGVSVRYDVLGTSGPRFVGLLSPATATATTNSKGIATAPALSAGARAGTFTIRATVVGRDVPPANFKATVTPAANGLTRTSLDSLTATTNAHFAKAVEVKATFHGKPVANLPLTATMITDDAEPVENDKGPYFKDDDEPVRTLTALKTGKDGLLTLPDIYTDGQADTFTLRLTTREGTTLDIELTVTAE